MTRFFNQGDEVKQYHNTEMGEFETKADFLNQFFKSFAIFRVQIYRSTL